MPNGTPPNPPDRGATATPPGSAPPETAADYARLIGDLWVQINTVKGQMAQGGDEYTMRPLAQQVASLLDQVKAASDAQKALLDREAAQAASIGRP